MNLPFFSAALPLCLVMGGMPAIAAPPCLSDDAIEAAIGPQVRSGALTVDTSGVPNAPLCSGLTLAQAIQRIRAVAFPDEARRAAAAQAALIAREAGVDPTGITRAETGTPQVPIVAPVDRAPGRPAARRLKATRTATKRTPVHKQRSAPPPVSRFASCREARAAGAAPLRRGSSGYWARLDRDGDGVACE